MRDDEYLELLKKAKSSLPRTISSHNRFEIPEIDILIEGKTTVWKNFQDICDIIHRDPEHVFGYLLKVLGTPGEIEGRRVIFKSKLMESQISKRLNEYLNNYVICKECGLPDTKLTKEGRFTILQCLACGAHRTVKQ